MKMNKNCEKCLFDKNEKRIPCGASAEKREAFLASLACVINENREKSAPEVVEKINELRCEFFGGTEDYTEIKKHFNALMLGLEEELWQNVNDSKDPLMLAVQYAMAGNFIDFGASESVDDEKLQEFLSAAKTAKADEAAVEKLRFDIFKAKEIVFFTDNCGEIVADKVLIRAMKKLNPNVRITAIVRGSPVLNDATREDAEQVRLDSVCDRVLDNGTAIAGTVMERMSEDAKKAALSADVIIAKGQGNYESLCGCGLPVHYIFMCKCELFVNRFRVPRYSGIITKEGEHGAEE